MRRVLRRVALKGCQVVARSNRKRICKRIVRSRRHDNREFHSVKNLFLGMDRTIHGRSRLPLPKLQPLDTRPLTPVLSIARSPTSGSFIAEKSYVISPGLSHQIKPVVRETRRQTHRQTDQRFQDLCLYICTRRLVLLLFLLLA